MEIIVDTKNNVYKEQIVRCKECRYYHQLYGCQKHDDIDLVTSDDDFCSYGEREGE